MFTRVAIEILCVAFRTGVYNLAVNWNKVKWQFGSGIRFTVCTSGLATYDSDELTNLVLLAHRECIRISISAAAPKYLYIEMHPRTSRDGSMFQRHPTIETAIAAMGD